MKEILNHIKYPQVMLKISQGGYAAKTKRVPINIDLSVNHAGKVVVHNSLNEYHKRGGYTGAILNNTESHVLIMWTHDTRGVLLQEHILRAYTKTWFFSNIITSGFSKVDVGFINEHIVEIPDVMSGKLGDILLDEVERLVSKSVPKQDQSNTRKGYIVWTPEDNSPNPSVVHAGVLEAEEEAKRLSIKHNKQFYVCKLVSVSELIVTVDSTIKSL